MRLGLVGCGHHGRTRLSAAMSAIEGVDLIACADVDRSAADWTAGQWGYAAAYSDYRRMLDEEDLDAVMVSLPHHLLADASVAAIESGASLFVEKPAGVNAEDAVRIRAAAEAAGTGVMVGYCMRYNPGRVRAREMVRDGVLGRPVQVLACKSATPLEHWNSRMEFGGGQLRWHGVHIVDQVLWMTGARPVRVHAETLWHPETGADRDTAFTILFEGGLTASVAVSASLSQPFDFVEVFGTGGRVRTEWPSEILDVQSDSVAEYGTQTRITPLLPDYNDMYRLQMRDWTDSLRAGRQPPIPVQAAVDVLSVIDAVYESAGSGSPVPVAAHR